MGLAQRIFAVSSLMGNAMIGSDSRFEIQLRDFMGNIFWARQFSRPTQTTNLQVGDNTWVLTPGWDPPKPDPFVLLLIWGCGWWVCT